MGSGLSLADCSFQREPAHYFGYVYFRQVKDSSVKRGYFQKVSHLAAWGRGCCQAGLVAIRTDGPKGWAS